MTVGLAGKQITYDYNNRPTSVVYAGATTSYVYGLGDQRRSKTVGAVTTWNSGIAEIRDFEGSANKSSCNHILISGL